ncbi:hypothetical protein ABFX02_13G171300 [Erythranthe guttata]
MSPARTPPPHRAAYSCGVIIEERHSLSLNHEQGKDVSFSILEYWAFEILVLLEGLTPNSKITTSVIAMWVNTETVHDCIWSKFSSLVTTQDKNILSLPLYLFVNSSYYYFSFSLVVQGC